jgi:hypothetical protein
MECPLFAGFKSTEISAGHQTLSPDDNTQTAHGDNLNFTWFFDKLNFHKV